MAERDVGSAWRRRERRLRSWLRHERMTVRMELAAALHHSSFRGAGPETHDAPRSQKTVNSREEAVFFELFDEDTAGWRPAPLPEVVGPQAQVLQRTMELIVDAVPLVPLLEDPVPQTVEQLVSFFKFLDTQMPVEQVIAVPKITKDLIQPRLVDCDQRYPQSAEQLVEVPTKISFPVIVLFHAIMEHKRRTVEQNDDIPAVGGSGTGGLSAFLPGQSSSVTAEQISLTIQFGQVVLEIYKVFPVDRVQQRFRSRSLSFPTRWRPSRFSASPGLHSVFLGFSWTSWSRGFFALFPKIKKKCDTTSALEVGTASALGWLWRVHGAWGGGGRGVWGGLWSGVRGVRQSLVWARVGPSSPAILLVAGLCRWVPGWPCHLAAAVAHRQRARMTCLVWQWIHGLRQFLCLCPIFFFLRDGELGSWGRWSCSLACRESRWMEKCAQSVLQLSSLFSHLEFGLYVMSPLYLAVPVRCLVPGAMLGSTMDTCSASLGWLLEVFYDFSTWLGRLGSWGRFSCADWRCSGCSFAVLGNLGIISTSLLCFQLDLRSNFCASWFFGALEHSQLWVFEGRWCWSRRDFTPRWLGTGSVPIHPEVTWTYALSHMSLNNQQPTTNNQQPTANSQQPTANRQPPTANRQPPTANRQPPTANSQQPQPTANSQQFNNSTIQQFNNSTIQQFNNSTIQQFNQQQPHTTVAVSTRPPTGSTSARRRCFPQGQSSGSGVEAPAENFLMAGGEGGRWAHSVGRCGGGGVAAAVAAGRAGCVSCCSSSTWWSMSLLFRSSTWVRPVLGQGCRLARCCARLGFGPDSAARGVPQLQFLDKVVTCPLLRRQVEFLDMVEICPLLRRQVQFLDQVVDMPFGVQRQVHLGAVLGHGGDMPVIVQRQVRSLRGDVVDTPVVAQMQIPLVQITTAILQLQYIDKVVNVCCAGPAVLECRRGGDSRAPTVAARWTLDRLLHARCVQRQVPCGRWRGAVHRWLWTSLWSCSDVLFRQWKCHRFSSSPESVDIPVRNRGGHSAFSRAAMKGVFGGSVAFFALFQVVPELSASFSEPSMAKSSLPSRAPMPISTAFVIIHIRLTSARVRNNNNNNNTIWGGSV